ncbi:hypothetical protein LCGC14_2075390, partial [marine sediment metagenome]
MGKTTHTIPIPRFPAPAGRYDRQNEAQFRRELERAYQDIVSYVAETNLDPATLADHVLATEAAIGAQHTVSGLTNRDVLVASSATAANFRALVEDDISNLVHYTSADFDTDFGGKSTSDLSEGTNLYYTDGRADARIGLANLEDLADVVAYDALTDDEILQWNTAAGGWRHRALAEAGISAAGHTHALNDITNPTGNKT